MKKLMKEQSNQIKENELNKYRDLVLATIDYQLQLFQENQNTGFDPSGSLEEFKKQVLDNYAKGRLSLLKSWFRNMTEPMRETNDLKFQKFIKDKTEIEVDIFRGFLKRIEKIIELGEIKTDRQFHDLNSYVDDCCQKESIDSEKIEKINKLLRAYEKRISK